MKRKLALLMAFMMAATLVPAQPANAATKNVVNKTVTAASDSKLDNATGVMLTLGKEGDTIKGLTENDYFELHLSGDAKWMYKDDAYGDQWEYQDENGVIHTFTASGLSGTVKVRRLTDTILGVQVQDDVSTPVGTNTTNYEPIEIPLLVDLNGTPEGTQKVSIVPKSSSATAGEYTYATVGASSIKFRVQKKEKISRSGSTKVQLIFDEMTASSFNGKEIKVKLPNGFTWGDGTSTNVDGTVGKADDDRTLVFKPLQSSKVLSAYLNYEIKPSRNAKYGDVDVTVEGEGASDVTPESLVVAEYVDYGVEVKAEKVLNVIAGKDIEGKYKAKLTIEEPAVSSLQGKRYMEFKFVDENGKDVNASIQDEQSLKLTRKSGDTIKLEIDDESID